MKFFLSLSTLLIFISPTFGEKHREVPRFVSLRPNEVNLRVGPGSNYPVEWIYLKSGFPVEIIAEFDTWRKIRDLDGTEGWVHQSMLCSKRHVIVQGEDVILYREASLQSVPLARLESGVVLNLLKSNGGWCHVWINDFKGWLPRSKVWGLYPQENLN